jgi:hypothetical protein
MQCSSAIAIGGIPARIFKLSKPKKANGVKPDLQQVLKKYERLNTIKALWQQADTFILYIILCILMYPREKPPVCRYANNLNALFSILKQISNLSF